MNSNIKYILQGKCPHCRKKVYTPSLFPTSDTTFHYAVALHAANCAKNPNYKETEIEKYMREIFGEG